MINKLLLLSCVIIYCVNVKAQEFQNTLIISDLDNTYKVTKGRTFVGDFKNILFSKKSYKGMPELFSDFKKGAARVVFLTNQTKLAENNVLKMLEKDKVSYDTILFRSSIFKSGKKHKKVAIEQLINKNSEFKVILMGDNLGADANIYKAIHKKYPTKILAIYIRPITKKKLPEGVITYKTTYDIRISEALFERNW